MLAEKLNVKPAQTSAAPLTDLETLIAALGSDNDMTRQ
jgi:hypothetical protein